MDIYKFNAIISDLCNFYRNERDDEDIVQIPDLSFSEYITTENEQTIEIQLGNLLGGDLIYYCFDCDDYYEVYNLHNNPHVYNNYILYINNLTCHYINKNLKLDLE